MKNIDTHFASGYEEHPTSLTCYAKEINVRICFF
jgi:hypothetical protein